MGKEDFARMSESTFFHRMALALKRGPESVGRSGVGCLTGRPPNNARTRTPDGRFFAVGRRRDCPGAGVQFDFEVGEGEKSKCVGHETGIRIARAVAFGRDMWTVSRVG